MGVFAIILVLRENGAVLDTTISDGFSLLIRSIDGVEGREVTLTLANRLTHVISSMNMLTDRDGATNGIQFYLCDFAC